MKGALDDDRFSKVIPKALYAEYSSKEYVRPDCVVDEKYQWEDQFSRMS